MDKAHPDSQTYSGKGGDRMKLQTALPKGFRPVGHFPKYLPPPKMLDEVPAGVQFASMATGWCMWPTIWDQDTLICDAITPIFMNAGFNAEKADRPEGCKTWRLWNQYDREIIVFTQGGRTFIKRLRVGSNPHDGMFQTHFHCDNAKFFDPKFPFIFGPTKEDIHIYGIVKAIVPRDRKRVRLPEEFHEEFDRINSGGEVRS